MDHTISRLGPTHHALLMAWMTREAFRVLGPIAADSLVRDAVRCYGHERGMRMAQRAAAHGHDLDWVSYMAYREWSAEDQPHANEIVAQLPQLHMRVLGCPWNDAWKAEGLASYGRLYCRDVDRAIVQGFNPALELSISRTLSGGDPCCEFVYIGFGMGPDEEARLAFLRAELGGLATLPWGYHLGHLYATMKRVYTAHTGAAGAAIAERALAVMRERLGARVAQLVADQVDVDYTSAPSGRLADAWEQPQG